VNHVITIVTVVEKWNVANLINVSSVLTQCVNIMVTAVLDNIVVEEIYIP
jgi:hypothetical protein